MRERSSYSHPHMPLTDRAACTCPGASSMHAGCSRKRVEYDAQPLPLWCTARCLQTGTTALRPLLTHSTCDACSWTAFRSLASLACCSFRPASSAFKPASAAPARASACRACSAHTSTGAWPHRPDKQSAHSLVRSLRHGRRTVAQHSTAAEQVPALMLPRSHSSQPCWPAAEGQLSSKSCRPRQQGTYALPG